MKHLPLSVNNVHQCQCSFVLMFVQVTFVPGKTKLNLKRTTIKVLSVLNKPGIIMPFEYGLFLTKTHKIYISAMSLRGSILSRIDLRGSTIAGLAGFCE